LWVGGATETEIKTRRDIAERTARVLRGAVTGGVLPGGGVALLRCQPALQQQLTQSATLEEKAACQILIKAMEAPVRTLIRNAGDDPAQFLGQIKRAGPGLVFDLRHKQMVDAATAGILDVAAVQKEAVERAVRSAALALTIDVLVHVKKPVQSTEP
jgi:chaperonin GroEL